ncbi:MAG: acetylesterase [Actinobacteria bacterium]|nr:acetylesterase [Actinomycetota bacterium]
MNNDGYDDWYDYVAARPRLTGDDWTTLVSEALGVPQPAAAPAPRVVGVKTTDGIRTTELAWSVGYGPEQHAWFLHPDDEDPSTLPGVLDLPCHAGIKSIGAVRLLADPAARSYQELYEDGVAFAPMLAARGVAVLAPDAFSWGSRRFDLSHPEGQLEGLAELLERAGVPEGERYDRLAGLHEHLVAKRAGAIGTSYAGMIAHDDLTSLAVLRSLTAGPVGVTGFSGGGGRAATLSALDGDIAKVSIVAMMATNESLIPDHLDCHSWLLNTPWRHQVVDVPEIAANRRTHDLHVVYCEQDSLFPMAGMKAADARLAELYAEEPATYEGVFVPGPHGVSRATHERVADFLTR